MGIGRNSIVCHPVLVILSFITLHPCIARLIIIRDPATVISSGGVFKLGFFSPSKSSNRYVGIWYNKIPEETVVWVANRENPVSDSSGVVMIGDDGNLAVVDGRKRVMWTSNVTEIYYNTTVELLDSRNLVLQKDNSSGRYLWESFKYPSHALFLPTMMIGVNPKLGEKTQLTSWKSNSDPSIGDFSLELDPVSIPQVIIWNGSKSNWRSGPWNNQIFIGISDMYSTYLNGFTVSRDVDQKGSVYVTVDFANKSLVQGYFLNSTGTMIEKWWDDEKKEWIQSWLGPRTECDIYAPCGPFGICDTLSSPICLCFKGFEPKSVREWSTGNWSGGCVKRTQFQCEGNNTNGENQKEDGFMKLEKAKVPDFPNYMNTANVEEREQECLKNCSCVAYSYTNGIGCMIWNVNLLDMQKFSMGGVDLYIRVAHKEIDKKRDPRLLIIITVVIGVVGISIFGCLLWRRITKMRGKKMKYKGGLYFKRDKETSPDFSDSNMLGESPELPVFTIEKLAIATNNFTFDNKLGEGGFGSVYKGKFSDGQEIAVKRLSKSSGQGSVEFKNEVVVISKLQHRNLVRLIGCCIEGEEKMLIYEYMSNKSLDAFLFDPTKRALLDWRKRFQIIEGICRGTLYLHRDSRLRVIHRDLKASNILLDEELNPKISDFGMARIFGGNELQANTIRVVGTYGYMSPEYAMEGIFSEKSDVFSLGVLLLEIVSGKRNTSFYQPEQSLSLLGHAWKLWNEDYVQALIDPGLLEPCFQEEILRCIHVGLLCVQEFAKDRPIVSIILSMLTSEIAHLPTPKQPAFTERQIYSDSEPSEKSHRGCSINNVSITAIQGR
ncbi:hypothetical protein GIB67_021776 [Kingdonia uniflora]|uniref:Receptor-like serine/threonine-protein kinase n=1 Tax=Kingdonia uniflora TaxID=39325 RepID=A0A7J7M9Y9_9MAGN|nr:hypothetical protein GIB67_021776 [Kingdonia uniflora]